MKLITRDTDYAIRALMYIASAGDGVVSVAEIEKKLGLPRPFLRKILQVLQKQGVLRSIKGNRGGFLLAVPAKKIILADLIEIFQGKITFTECFLKKKECPDTRKCSVRKKIKNIEKTVVSELKQITIASLLECE
ncbi:MAG: Rrf2 family transcriptional regulator [Candidatus Omnitrophica bacterium]|nr:Rrf2 family transcriptional regulator [Candidatus Omnitrophota bacterium]